MPDIELVSYAALSGAIEATLAATTEATAATADAVAATVTDMGVYDPNTQYGIRNQVFHLGSSWVSNAVPPLGNAPEDGSLYWKPVAKQGSPGLPWMSIAVPVSGDFFARQADNIFPQGVKIGAPTLVTRMEFYVPPNMGFAPIGAPLTLRIKKNGVLLLLISIAAGTESTVSYGSWLFEPGDFLTFDYTSIGTTFPGKMAGLVMSGGGFNHGSYISTRRIFSPIGAHASAGWERPENTMAAFTHAVALGQTPESDLRITLDGVLVISHDDNLLRVSGTSLSIAASNLSAVQAVDVGSLFHPNYSAERVPTLAAALAAFPYTPWEFENKIRTAAFTRAMCDALVATGRPTQYTYCEFGNSMTNFNIVRDEYPDIVRKKAYFQTSDSAPVLATLQASRISVISVQAGTAWFDAAWITSAHASGFEVEVWTIDTRMDRQTYLNMGVDKILSNHPAYLNNDTPRSFAEGVEVDNFDRNNAGPEWTGAVYTPIGSVGIRFNNGFAGTGTVAALDGRVWGALSMDPARTYVIDTEFFPRALVGDSTRWVALQLLKQDKGIRTFSPVPADLNGLQFQLTQAGQLAIVKLVGGLSSSVLAVQSGTGAWAVDVAIPLRITISPAQLKVKRLDTAFEITSSDTAIRGGFLGMMFSSSCGQFGPWNVTQS